MCTINILSQKEIALVTGGYDYTDPAIEAADRNITTSLSVISLALVVVALTGLCLTIFKIKTIAVTHG